jgi:alanyl-tRNA synthetase
VTEKVIDNSRVTTIETTKEAAERMGALAFFGDKYGDQVRVVKAGDYSTEFCGGTHVPSTGQIGPLVLVSEGSVAANTRRVEALTGVRAYEHLLDLRRQLEGVAAELGTQPAQLLAAARSITARLSAQEERIEQFESQLRVQEAVAIAESAEAHDGRALVVATRPGLAGDALRALALQVRERLGSSIGVLGSEHEGKGTLIAWATDDLVAEGVNAGELIADAASRLGGGGSRDPRLAQAGGPNGDELGEALEVARSKAQEALLAL